MERGSRTFMPLGSTNAIVNLFAGACQVVGVSPYSSRAGSLRPGCQFGAKPSVVSTWVLAVVLASIGSGRSVHGCLRRHSRQSLIASSASDSNLDPQLHRSRIIHRARLCKQRLLGLALGR